MQQLNYDIVYNPFKPVEGLMIDIKTQYSQFLENPEKLRSHEFLEKVFLTDSILLCAPS